MDWEGISDTWRLGDHATDEFTEAIVRSRGISCGPVRASFMKAIVSSKRKKVSMKTIWILSCRPSLQITSMMTQSPAMSAVVKSGRSRESATFFSVSFRIASFPSSRASSSALFDSASAPSPYAVPVGILEKSRG